MAQIDDRDQSTYEDPKGPGNRTIRSVDHGGRLPREKVGRQRVILFDDLAHDYLTHVSEVRKRSVRQDVARMRRLLSEFGGIPATRVSRGNIEAFMTGLATQGLAPATINRYLDLLRATYNHGIRCNTVQYNPMQGVRPLKVNTTRLRILTEEEETRLFAELPKSLHAIVEIDLLTGLRHSDLVGLEWRNVDLEAGIYTVQMIKSRGALRLPMHPRVREILASLPQNGPYVFPGAKQRKPRGLIGRSFRNAVRRASIADFSFRDLRTTWAVRLVQAGVDSLTIRRLGGWSTLHIIQHFAHHSLDHLREAIARLKSRHTATATDTDGKSPNAERSGETGNKAGGKEADTGVDPA